MSSSNQIEQTYVTGGGLKAEQICEEKVIKPFVEKHPEWTYKNVSQDKTYQKIDVDYVLLKPGKEIRYEIKGDAESSKTGNFFIEFITHTENLSNEVKALFFDYIMTNDSFSINDFYAKLGYLIPPSSFGCNYKTESHKTVFVPLVYREDIKDYVVSDTLPVLSVDSEKLKDYKFNKKYIYIPKSKSSTPGLVKHKDGSENIGIAVKPKVLIFQKIAKKINVK